MQAQIQVQQEQEQEQEQEMSRIKRMPDLCSISTSRLPPPEKTCAH